MKITRMRLLLWSFWLPTASIILALTLIENLDAANFVCPSANVTCLVAAINEANSNGQENVIDLQSGVYTLTAINNVVDGPNGLPSITSTLTIRDDQMGATIERDPHSSADFRIFHVESRGNLTLFGLGLRYGRGMGGGAVFNKGVLTIESLAIYENQNVAIDINRGGGGILSDFPETVRLRVIDSEISHNNSDAEGLPDDNFGGGIAGGFGAVEIVGSSIFENTARTFGGGLSVSGPTHIQNSSIHDNRTLTGFDFRAAGGGIHVDNGPLTLVSSTVARNRVEHPFGSVGGILAFGEILVTNSTIAGNQAQESAGGIFASSVEIQNSILAKNTARLGNECLDGEITSLGNNVFGDISLCNIVLGVNDLIGDPGLADWQEEFYPLLGDSPAIDSANPNACPTLDQNGTPRVDLCDRGAVEYQGRLLVSIDIRPLDGANRIDPNSKKDIAVVLLSVGGFDATTVDPTSVRFGATGKEAAPIHVATRDFERDKDKDLMLRFETRNTEIECGDSVASLTGKTFDGRPIIASSQIRTVPCGKHQRTRELFGDKKRQDFRRASLIFKRYPRNN